MIDFFIHVRGPRIRDRVAHYELLPSSIPNKLIDLFVCFFVFLANKFSREPSKKYSEATEIILEKIRNYFLNYKSIYSPAYLYQKLNRKATRTLENFSTKIEETRNLQIEDADLQTELLDTMKIRLTTNEQQNLENLVDLFDLLPKKLAENYQFPFDCQLSFCSDSTPLSLCFYHFEENFIYFPLKSFGYSNELATKVTIATQIVDTLLQLVSSLFEKWNFFSSNLLGRSLNKRQVNAFDKLANYIDYFILSFKLIMLVTEDCVRAVAFDSTQKLEAVQKMINYSPSCTGPPAKVFFPVALLNKLLSAIQKALTKLQAHKWDEIFVSLHQLAFTPIVERYKKIK